MGQEIESERQRPQVSDHDTGRGRRTALIPDKVGPSEQSDEVRNRRPPGMGAVPDPEEQPLEE
jgi:hypothetical protein